MKDFFNKLLTGMSLGIVVCLIPNALVGEILKLIIPHAGPLETVLTSVLNASVLVMSLLPVIMGVLIGIQFKLNPVQMCSIGLAAFIGSGVTTIAEDGTITMAGIGTVINIGITAALATLFVKFLDAKLKEWTLLLMPALTIFIPGLIGLAILPYVRSASLAIGEGIIYLTNLQPVLMGMLIAMVFSVLILSPISTIGVATAIMISGVAAGAANLGVAASGVGMCIAAYKANNLGTAIAHIASAKIQMRNFFMKPKIALPMILTAAILGALSGVLQITGTPYSAGFGLAGFVGPLKYLDLAGWNVESVTIAVTMFIVLPVILNLFFIKLFEKKFKWIESRDYLVSYEN
ncbi:PTS transporter subunit IIC [Ureibacillus terrenus]|uniref:PTS sugar transporter subunit IIC n=1 Tax=Ureibacillus terrenus TaxID=118246 RepID=A0A540V172_9BACL|nr:PTS sugar transporter subunit IIC [Ureibacillus terrenus]MED3662975.1 PTS sugar transporter subunit IIC [Ureibacillus terrenus]MED3765102.1 PTS sugar transporter subunit IIC [Ureibacillus terrenus]TQE90476.1 PTS sugar transporter subunit IIC [Ureibacillus terrenus]